MLATLNSLPMPMRSHITLILLLCIYCFVAAVADETPKAIKLPVYIRVHDSVSAATIQEDTLIITKKRDNMEIIIYPNPFKKNSTINFSLVEKDFVTIKLYDVEGRVKKTILKSGEMSKGDHVVEFTRNELEGGFYLIQVMTRNGSFAKQVILIE
jgi:hypothetical protein